MESGKYFNLLIPVCAYASDKILASVGQLGWRSSRFLFESAGSTWSAREGKRAKMSGTKLPSCSVRSRAFCILAWLKSMRKSYRRGVGLYRWTALSAAHKSKMYLGLWCGQRYFQPRVVLWERLRHSTNGLAVWTKNAIFYLVEGIVVTSNNVANGVEKLQQNSVKVVT